MIHICYALYDKSGKYSKNAGTSMLSIFENTKEWITIHLLHDNTLTEANKALFIKLVRKYGQHICFYNMDELDLPSMRAVEKWNASRFSKAAFYRLLVDEVLPSDVQRLIYLDSDMIVNLNIKELWEEDLNGAPLGAIPEQEIKYGLKPPKGLVASIDDGTIESQRYFNSGVLLIDRRFLHLNILEDGLKFLEKHPRYTLPDQDILNYYFTATYQPLKIRYNLFVGFERFMEHEINNAMYHYTVHAFSICQGDAFDRLWAKYYTMSPWFTGDIFCAACRISAIAMADTLNSFWRSTRGRSFTLVGSSEDAERFQKLLNLGQGDRFLSLYDKPNVINFGRIIEDMKKHLLEDAVRKPLYMFVTPHYDQFGQKISEAGFKEGEDFLNATWFIDALEHRYPKAVENFVWDNI